MNNADKQYQDLLKNIITNGRQKGDRTGTGTISIPFATLDFDMSEGFPLLTTKKVFTKAIIHELLWFLRGDTNIRYLEDNGVTIWTSDAYREYKKAFIGDSIDDIPLSMTDFSNAIKTPKANIVSNYWTLSNGWDLGPVYGAQWRRWRSDKKHVESPDEFDDYIFIDQIQEAMDKLINNPDDRRIMVSAWNVADIDKMALPPCHYGFQLYTEELTTEEREKIYFETYGYDAVNMEGTISDNIPKRRLSLIWDQRSCDTFLGIPFNIASYGILLHMFAQQANMVPGRLIGSLKNVHIYNNHKDQCLEQISRDAKILPILQLTKAKDIFSYSFDDIKFVNYNPHDKIAGAISV